MLRYPRTSQPKGGAKPEIDWNNPLTRGLVGVVIPHIGELINHGTVSIGTSTSYLQADPSGNMGLRYGTEGIADGWSYPGAWSRIAGELSVFSFSRLLATPGGSRREVGNFQGGTVQGSYCLVPNGTQFRMQYIGSGGTSVQALGASVDQKLHFHVGTVTSATVAIYTDGILGGTISAPGFGSAISGSDFEILGDSGGGASSPSVVFMAGVYNRALSASEIAALARNPWQIFKPIVVPVKTASSGVSGSGSPTNANDTSSGSGTTTIVGTLAKTNANDTSAGTGTTTVTGTVNYTNNNDTCAGSGTAGAITGTVNYTNNNDTAVGTGWAGIVTGTVNYTNRNDTSSGVGLVVGRGGITGDNRKKRRYVAKIGDRLVVFDSADRALNAIRSDDGEPDAPVVVPAKKTPPRLPKDAETVQAVQVKDIQNTARVYEQEQRVMDLFRKQRYAEMVALYQALRNQEDDDEIELLMLA